MSEIKLFIDFFYDACKKIRREKAVITRGKDGKLTKLALKRLSLNQLEQLALWFLAKKPGLSPTVGAMLSKSVLKTLEDDIKRPDFWKEINKIYNRHFPASEFAKNLAKKFKPFSYRQIAEIAEETAALERKNG
jgi:hypothetical protein